MIRFNQLSITNKINKEMSKILLDPECTEETFHTRDFLLFKKIRRQYEISSKNYSREFYKKYICGKELFDKMNRINTIMNKKLDKHSLLNKENYLFDTDHLNATILDLHDYTPLSLGDDYIPYDTAKDLESQQDVDNITKQFIEEKCFGLSSVFNFKTVSSKYNNILYRVFDIEPEDKVYIISSHYKTFDNKYYQYLYIFLTDVDFIRCGMVLYYNPTSDIVYDKTNKEDFWDMMSQYNNLLCQPLITKSILDHQCVSFIKCDKPIFDDYSMQMLRFYRWSKYKQIQMSNAYGDPQMLPSYKFLFSKWLKTKNLDNLKASEEEFLKELFMYDKNFINEYRNKHVESDLSTQWFVQIYFSVILHILENSLPNFISSRDNLYLKENRGFVRSNEIMITDYIVSTFED